MAQAGFNISTTKPGEAWGTVKVAGAHRRQGIGSMLSDALFVHLREIEAKHVTSFVRWSEEGERWGSLYEQVRPNLVRALAAAAGSYDGVEDAIHEAFAAALAGAPSDLRSPEAWLFVVALNKLRNQQRRSRLAMRLRLARPADPHELDQALQRADVIAALQRLSQRERTLLVAKYYVGLTQDEIAKHFGIPRGTVSSAVSRAASHLRELEKAHG